MSPEPVTSNPATLVTFTLHDHTYGVDVARVQEVLRPQQRTRVPLAPPAVAGLINLRGQVMTAIDLRTQLDLPPRPAGHEPLVVVIRVPGDPVGLLVDSIGAVVEGHHDDYEPSPHTLTPAVRALLRGVYKTPDSLLLDLDVDRALTT